MFQERSNVDLVLLIKLNLVYWYETYVNHKQASKQRKQAKASKRQASNKMEEI